MAVIAISICLFSPWPAVAFGQPSLKETKNTDDDTKTKLPATAATDQSTARENALETDVFSFSAAGEPTEFASRSTPLQSETQEVRRIAFSSDGKTLVSGGYDKTVRVWDLTTGKQTALLEGHTAAVRSVALSAAGRAGETNWCCSRRPLRCLRWSVHRPASTITFATCCPPFHGFSFGAAG